MRHFFLLSLLFLAISTTSYAQPCTPQGDEVTYGTGNIWRGYVYNNSNLGNYRGYVTEGSASSPNFDENFGGDDVTYATNGCGTQTETFSVRYKLRKNFAAGTYTFTIGGDDGYRFSVTGGSSWLIDNWVDQGYTTSTATVTLSGNTDLVLEYYERNGANRISFNVTTACTNGTENTGIYGTNNVWRGYLYDGTNFNTYYGMVTEGSASSPNFDESFTGNYANYATSGCPIYTETFSARYRLTKNFPTGTYRFTVGGDDGYRLSVSGVSGWLIDGWVDQAYTTRTATVNLSGNVDIVLEFYENAGGNRLSFDLTTISVLPIDLLHFNGQQINNQVRLNWSVTPESTPKVFGVERSAENGNFQQIGEVNPTFASKTTYQYVDPTPVTGRSSYRLKMTDENGRITYSNNISFNTANNSSSWRIFPTLVTNGTVQLQAGNSVSSGVLQVSDISGRLLIRRVLTGVQAGSQFKVDLSAISHTPGIYTVQVIQDNDMFTSRIVVP